MSGVTTLPEQGQLVQVRSRQWVVNEVKPSTLPPDALRPDLAGPQHLLTMASVEGDGQGSAAPSLLEGDGLIEGQR